MDHVLAVGEVQRLGDGQQQADRLPPGNRSLLDAALERPAGQVFHHQVGTFLIFAEIGHFDDMGMRQPRQGFRLALEAFERALQDFRGKALRADDFHRYVRLEAGVVGFVDGRHPALAELFEDVVASEGLVEEVGHFIDLLS
ncbi:MAG: hypothetical protein IANPNBLG_04100 [Bryobacteraceae bacterium]|nr:hypothetical protein [Bryobacteraceae bacterium]